jgi:hypothetical protein
MLVSNFYVGYNQFCWPGGNRTAAGYALQITNLEHKPIEFGIECRITRLFGQMAGESVPAFLKLLFGKTWHKDAGGYYAFDRWKIDPNGVGEWRLAMGGGRVTWPWNWNWQERTIFDVLGYVSLRVPVRRAGTYPYALEPQSDHPVQVLLSAWREDQWLVPGSGVDPMQSSSLSSIQLAAGKAANEIPPDVIPYFSEFSVSDYLTRMVRVEGAEKSKGAMDVAEEDRAQALIDLLGALPRDEREIEALNRVLQDLKVPLSIRAKKKDIP